MSRKLNKHNQDQPAAKNIQPIANRKDCIVCKCPTSITVCVKENPADKQRYADEEDYRRRQSVLASRLNWITAIGITGALVGLLFTYQSLQANRHTLELLKSDQRAWVGVEDAKPSNYVRLWNGQIQMEVLFTLRNYGRSAAQRVQVYPDLEIMSDANRNNPACKSSYAPNDLGYVVLPTEQLPETHALNISPRNVEDAARSHPQDRNIFLSVRGCVIYSDGITDGETHHTPFSYALELVRGRYVTVDTVNIDDADMKLTKLVIDPGQAD